MRYGLEIANCRQPSAAGAHLVEDPLHETALVGGHAGRSERVARHDPGDVVEAAIAHSTNSTHSTGALPLQRGRVLTDRLRRAPGPAPCRSEPLEAGQAFRCPRPR